MRFAGHWRDYLGWLDVENTDYLDYMHARYYDPNNGRFLSVDPKSRRRALRTPQLYNRYSYALNNPVSNVDLDGEDVTPIRVLIQNKNFASAKPRIVYVDSRMVSRIQTLVSTAHSQGVSFTFNNMLRTPDQQDAIKTGNTKNVKGTSPHTAGLALDINISTSLKGTDLAGLTTIARGADLSPLRNQADDKPHFQANDLITRGKDGKVDDQFIALVEENQKQVEDYEKLRKDNPEEFERHVIEILPPKP